jgi:hypothetical protein
LVKAAT